MWQKSIINWSAPPRRKGTREGANVFTAPRLRSWHLKWHDLICHGNRSGEGTYSGRWGGLLPLPYVGFRWVCSAVVEGKHSDEFPSAVSVFVMLWPGKYCWLFGMFIEQTPAVRCCACVCINGQLGVNGYSFAITNNGYVIFHPRFDPMVRIRRASLRYFDTVGWATGRASGL